VNGDNTPLVLELIENYSSLLLIKPNNVKSLILRGLLWEQQKNYELAINDFNSLISIGNKMGYYLRAYSYCSLGKLNLALIDVKEADNQMKQPMGLFQCLAYITKRRNEIVREIEKEYLKDRFGEKYDNMNFINPN